MTLYNPTAWVSGTTPLSAPNMNKLEAGVRGAMPVGSVIRGYAESNGFLELDGSVISRTTYAALFNYVTANDLIGAGKPFGVGDGSATFQLPYQPPVSAVPGLRYYVAT